MQQNNPNSSKNTTMTVRIPLEISSKLDGLARDTKRSKAYLAGEAISSYVQRNAWQVARIKDSLEDAKSGTPGIPHEEMERWVESWGSDNELPPPEPVHRV
jgi:predicted transcriptional regulator